jgi:hypothetical protein
MRRTGASSECVGDGQTQAHVKALAAQYTAHAATWNPCLSCCTAGYALPGQLPCMDTADPSGGGGGGDDDGGLGQQQPPPRCDTLTTCAAITQFYHELSALYLRCPAQLPPELQAAVASASLSQALLQHFFELNTSALQLPPQVRWHDDGSCCSSGWARTTPYVKRVWTIESQLAPTLDCGRLLVEMC